MADMTVAKTILEQLGGRMFAMMTGAKNFTGSADGLSFRLPGSGGFTKAGINAVKITLTPADTYDVSFMRIRGSKVTEVQKAEGIYCDGLQSAVTLATGLCTSIR